MNLGRLDSLIEIMSDFVDEPGKTWREKRDEILDELNTEHRTVLLEFCSWFAGD